MPGDDKIMKVIEKAKGKRPKARKISEEVSGTKSQGLPKDIKQTFESHFNAKLSAVRLHTGGNATDIAKSLGAKSFSQGSDIFFSKAADASNKELVAHELAHLLQQGGGRKMPPANPGKVFVTK